MGWLGLFFFIFWYRLIKFLYCWSTNCWFVDSFGCDWKSRKFLATAETKVLATRRKSGDCAHSSSGRNDCCDYDRWLAAVHPSPTDGSSGCAVVDYADAPTRTTVCQTPDIADGPRAGSSGANCSATKTRDPPAVAERPGLRRCSSCRSAADGLGRWCWTAGAISDRAKSDLQVDKVRTRMGFLVFSSSGRLGIISPSQHKIATKIEAKGPVVLFTSRKLTGIHFIFSLLKKSQYIHIRMKVKNVDGTRRADGSRFEWKLFKCNAETGIYHKPGYPNPNDIHSYSDEWICLPSSGGHDVDFSSTYRTGTSNWPSSLFRGLSIQASLLLAWKTEQCSTFGKIQ